MPFSSPSSSAPETQHDYIRTLESRLAARDKIISGLLEEMEIHRILLDESTDPNFMFQAGGKYLYVNRAFATGVGKPVEAIAGHNIHDVFTPDEAEKRLKALDWVFRNAKTLEIEVRVPTTTGDTFYITTIKPILNESQNVRIPRKLATYSSANWPLNPRQTGHPGAKRRRGFFCLRFLSVFRQIISAFPHRISIQS